MFQSQMQLEHFCVDYLEIKTKPHKSSEPRLTETTDRRLGIDFDVFRNEKNNEFLIPLKVEITAEDEYDCFEKVAIHLKGIFSFNENTNEEEIKKYVPLLCLTNLFGIARGIIAQATSLCCDGPFLLPLINMNIVIKQKSLETSEKHIPDKDISEKAPQKKKKIQSKEKPADSKSYTKKRQTQ